MSHLPVKVLWLRAVDLSHQLFEFKSQATKYLEKADAVSSLARLSQSQGARGGLDSANFLDRYLAGECFS